tara:strand:+ start:105 stop:551 length:447 start_codon:yes stop_codon:yes gene_type:complete
MADRPHQNLSDRMSSATKDIIDNKVVNFSRMKNPESFSRELDEMLAALHLQLNTSPGDIEDILKSHQRITNGWSTKKGHLLDSHRQTYHAYTLIKDEENIITRVERRGHLYALGFRVLTTLFIGLSVMAIYALADHWGVDMPLMRLSS